MGRPKKTEADSHSQRIDFRAPPGWKARAEEAARRAGVPFSAYVRMVISERMDQDGIPTEQTKPRKPKP